MLSYVSHEMRTPLNCIIGMLQSLEDTTINSELTQRIDPAIASGKYLLAMINDILDMNQIKAGKFKLNEMDFDINLLFKDVFSLFHIQALTKQINTTFEISNSIPDIINTDPNRLKQIIINLLGNKLI